MTTYTSDDVIPAAIRNLLALLEDDPRFANVQQAFGPVRDVDREHVFIGDSLDEDDVDWATIGPVGTPGQKMDLTSSFSVTCAVSGVSKSPLEAFTRAFELRGLVEQVIRANQTLGLATVFAARVKVGRLRHQFVQDTEGTGCDAGLVVRIQARI